MKKTGTGFGALALATTALLIVASNAGLIGIDWPWEKISMPDVLTDETEVTMPAEAEIYEIEPVALDCRARIHAAVPVEGRREHRMLGQVYRTDTVTMKAVGDIDTCVDASSAIITPSGEGSFQVIVPADAITFERPRVDAEATRDTVRFDKGMIGKLTDVFPWVSDDSGLTPAAYAYAQQVVGSSECMEQAWALTESVIRDAYRDQLASQGGDPDAITVHVSGVPAFGAEPADVVDDFDFEVAEDGVSCRVAREAYGNEVTQDAAA